jgi:heme-degrading monooxygenase HmoA
VKEISDIGRLNRRTLLTKTWLVFVAGLLGWRMKASAATGSGPEFLSEPRVAREWRGKVKGTRAAEYQKYLFDQGIVKLSQIEGNLGVQMFTIEDGEATEFVVTSYWPNLEAIRKYAPRPRVSHHVAGKSAALPGPGRLQSLIRPRNRPPHRNLEAGAAGYVEIATGGSWDIARRSGKQSSMGFQPVV